MDSGRDRSSSVGNQMSHGQSQSQSPYQNLNGDNSMFGMGLDGLAPGSNNNLQYSAGDFTQNQGLTFDNSASYLIPQQDQNFPQSSMSGGFNQNLAFQQNDFDVQFKQENLRGIPQQGSFTPELSSNNFSSNQVDFNLYTQNNGQDETYDPSAYMNTPSPSQSVNPADLMSDMSSPANDAQSPSNLLTPESIQPQPFPSHTPSAFNQGPFSRSPGHSRHASLGPESAAFPNAQIPADWTGMMPTQFMNHRRSPSEYSDISSLSAVPSPNLAHHDSFEGNEHHSPLFQAQGTNSYPDGLELNNFSLSDNNPMHQTGMSPSHTPHMSPHLGPQQSTAISPQQQFLLNFGFPTSSPIYAASTNMNGQYQNSQSQQDLQRNGPVEMGQAQQMIPPEINVEFAPASRQNSFEPPKPVINEDGLTPPDRGRNRRRAASDLTGTARPATPASGSGANLSITSSTARSLSPGDRFGHGSRGIGRRQSTSALPNRDYILNLADPDHHPVSGPENGNARRVQKHPATFQCTLCPKRFTRAYNLRSHLRTHTDERPFVCTVCGKAFARQHDRKRHEGLHSGEKKFVCKGELKQGNSWGCGRRFARADALGRHFRSEAGRVCIKPLLDEEAIERQRLWQEQQMQNMAQNMQQQPQSIGFDANGFPIDASGNYTLPAALLAQYPALATLSWDSLGQGDGGMDDDISGRSSFDASASDYYDEGGDDGYLSSGPGSSTQQFGQPQQQQQQQNYPVDYKSDF